MTSPLIIEASGSHRSVGRQVGEAGREVIEWGLDAYAERFEGLAGFSFAEAVERARDYLRPAEDYVPQAVEQLRGMAEAANVPFDHLFALNCSEEFTCRADRNWPPEHCTSFAVVADGRPVAGHNEDWYPEEIEAQTVRIVRLTGRYDSAAYISAGPAYNLPITGVTAAGFSSAANTVYYRDERVGVPNNLLLTAVLGQPDLERATRSDRRAAPRARGSNHLLCDARGRVWDIETSGERWTLVDGSPPPPQAASCGRDGALRAHQPLRVAGARAGRRLTLRGLAPAPRARRAAAARGSRRPGTIWSSWASACCATTRTRRSASATTGRTTTRTPTRA